MQLRVSGGCVVSTAEAATCTAVIVGALLLLLALGLCRAAGRASRMEEERAATSPDAFIGDLEARMKAYGAAVADYYDTTSGD